MTAEGAIDDGAVIVDFETKPKEAKATTTFALDGEPLTATEVKGGTLLKIARLGRGSEEEQAAAVDLFLNRVMDEKSAKLIYERLEDEDDDFDVDDLLPIMEWLQGQWSQRRPTQQSKSRGPRRSPGRRSTARAR